MKRIKVRTLYGEIRIRFLSDTGEVVGEITLDKVSSYDYEWVGKVPVFVSHIQVMSGETYLSPDKYKLEVEDL